MNVNVRSERRSWLLPLAILLALLLLVVIVLAFRGTAPPAVIASPTPTRTATVTATATARSTTTATPTSVVTTRAPAATVAAASPTIGPCANAYVTGDGPIVAPRASGQHLRVALDDVFGGAANTSRWAVRFFVPQGAPGNATVPLSASVVGPSGPLTIGRYEYGPPSAGTVPTTEPVTVQPCDQGAPPGLGRGAVVVVFETSRVNSGTYTLIWDEIRLPEGGFRDESWTVTLTCDSSGACK